MAKDCVSILVCANADGTHRLKPMVVGKATKPQALKNIMNALSVIYKGNKAAWFTCNIFHTWFHTHNVPVIIKYQTEEPGISRDNVKVILLLHNAPAHSALEELVGHGGRIKVLYLPPNTI
ncbi:Tigger transposable element-derived protein 7-like 35 [Homarus americanus]|uniref:Tigger transposable element-derived protein 7-like 35 n=1 Tax=Homarus americanus TaxID=6706 RepID=A0A8J5JZD4_HOMAM|nr:Tigger transposable element-derived protein 7-like 35 [Homarus americanus]